MSEWLSTHVPAVLVIGYASLAVLVFGLWLEGRKKRRMAQVDQVRRRLVNQPLRYKTIVQLDHNGGLMSFTSRVPFSIGTHVTADIRGELAPLGQHSHVLGHRRVARSGAAMKCADLPDDAVLNIIAHSQRPLGATIWEVFEGLPAYPQNVVRAKLSKLIRRRIIKGCICGCRGDFTVTQLEAVRDRLDGGGLSERHVAKSAQRVTDTIDDLLFDGKSVLRCSQGYKEQS